MIEDDETVEEMMRRVESAPWEATIREHRRWGPRAWSFELGHGLTKLSSGPYAGPAQWHAWSLDHARRKAGRIIGRRTRWERRRFPERAERQPPVFTVTRQAR